VGRGPRRLIPDDGFLIFHVGGRGGAWGKGSQDLGGMTHTKGTRLHPREDREKWWLNALGILTSLSVPGKRKSLGRGWNE